MTDTAQINKCIRMVFLGPALHTLLEERVPRGTLKGNSDCFIFGTLKGTSKNPMRGYFVKYPLMGVPLGTLRVL